ncbi:hypothetical protein RFN57_29705 [Streptomyces violaceochromogenes]|uniref:Secreted protein n=1 Tax=Streptomyces violaceochromogenes TaxID=67377 RepID=A0ABU6M4K1_9ACTN|nr:hypothetical protein [Streptomyces violaceochromogenes]MEC7056431.1 hypothetical protein [Streptomyces violaceochromogenes]GHC67166.1 hypothetical protein GCM10010309_31860 [Streptomyces violaceochromogenes]
MRDLMRALALGTTLVASLLVAPQAIAQDAAVAGQRVAGTSVQLSAAGAQDAQTRAVAAAAPAAVSASATLCGSGYELEFAERLPDSRRYGTLFSYVKSTVGKHGVCVVFDNNTSSAKKMKLKLCPNLTGATCKVDEGTFSQYAGPLKYESSNGLHVMCSEVTALMWDSSGRAIIDRVRSATLCD